MKGLLLKDYYMFIKYCRSYILIALIFVACSIVDQNNLFMLVYPSILSGMTAVGLLGYDEKSRWQQYCETLPYTREQVVASKYLLALILIASLSILLTVAHSLSGLIRGHFDAVEVLNIFCLVWSVGNLYSAICLPMIFKFGSEKGRMMYIGVAVVFCVAFVSMNMAETEVTTALNMTIANSSILIAAAIISAVCYCISLKLSEQFYLKREL